MNKFWEKKMNRFISIIFVIALGAMIYLLGVVGYWGLESARNGWMGLSPLVTGGLAFLFALVIAWQIAPTANDVLVWNSKD